MHDHFMRAGYAAGGGAAGANLSMVLRSRQNHEKPLRRDPYSKRYRPSLLNRDMRPDVSQMLLMHQQEPMRHGMHSLEDWKQGPASVTVFAYF